MPPIQDDALCIRLWDFSETSQTVSVFSRAHGVIRGLAKGAKRSDARFSGGFDLLQRGDLHAFLKPGDGLANIVGWDLRETFPSLRRQLDSFRAGMAIADTIHHAVRDRDPHEELFDAAVSGLREIGAGGDPLVPVAGFLLATLSTTGYRPDFRSDAENPDEPLRPAASYSFYPALGAFGPDRPGEGRALGMERWRVRGKTLDCLARLADADRQQEEVPRDTLRRAAQLLSAYLGAVAGVEAPAVAEFLRSCTPRTVPDVKPMDPPDDEFPREGEDLGDPT